MPRQTADDEVKRKRALKTPVHGDCQVCGQPGHGSHFGVLACRACAAFFRRTVVMNRQYSCRRANGSCQISKDERYLCRLCRYNKCIMLGMTPDSTYLQSVEMVSAIMCSGIGMCCRQPLKVEIQVHVVGRSTADSTTMDMKPERELDVLTTEQQSKARLHTYIAALMFSCIL
ncbi:zinc finger, C4 type [Ancylostoma ceylanicum]|uniref:Zinc finger, C4 type n=1 Tax=Ancylostoma ceylanicum TaxID=53326 RepID=A0A0D6L7Z0_9BILA|nr:zinc finger, C4 type [Ancylostoma ceylanicum]